MRKLIPVLALAVVLSATTTAPAKPDGRVTRIAGVCTLDGEARFSEPIGTVPQPRSLEGSGPFVCTISIDGGPIETFTAALSMGRYHEDPSGMIGCAASVFTGLAVIELDQPLPGGYTAILDRFEAASQGPSFWHHGAFLELGRIHDGAFVAETTTGAPSEASGEYIASVERPEQCLSGDLEGLTFSGPAAFTLTYRTFRPRSPQTEREPAAQNPRDQGCGSEGGETIH